MSQPEHPSREALWQMSDVQVREHVDDCAACRERLEQVQAEQHDVRRWLSSSARVVMPGPVAQRVQRALSEQARERTVVTLGARHESVSPRRAVPQRWLLAASVAAVSVVGAALVVPGLVGSGGDDSSASAPVAGEASAPELDSSAESADDTAGSVAGGLPPVPDDLVEQVEGQRGGAAEDCGQALATQLDAALQSATRVDDPRGGVLVVLDEQGTSTVWWLPTCTARAEQALGRSGLGPP